MMPEDQPHAAGDAGAGQALRGADATADGAALITVDAARFMPTVKSLNYIPAIIRAAQTRARLRRHRGALLRRGGRHHRVYDEQFFHLQRRPAHHPGGRKRCRGITRHGGPRNWPAICSRWSSARYQLRRTGGGGRGLHHQHHQGSHADRASVDDIVIGNGRPGARTQRSAPVGSFPCVCLCATHAYMISTRFISAILFCNLPIL
jgi:hypothetical protein